MNVENIKRLIKHLQKEEVDYNQKTLHHECGTPACIAGHSAYLSTLERVEQGERVAGFKHLNHCETVLEAEDFLGLEQQAKLADKLFNAHPLLKCLYERGQILGILDDRTVQELGRKYGRDVTEVSKSDAIKVLEHLIETGEADWGVCLVEVK